VNTRLTLSKVTCLVLVALVGLISPSANCQAFNSSRSILITANVGFRFRPPRDLFDITFGTVSHIDQLNVLLLCRSGFDDKLPGWRSLVVETYPRDQLKNSNDLSAALKVSRMVVGPRAKELETPRPVEIGSLHFVLSQFELQDTHVVKYGRVYTTSFDNYIVAFAFSSNSNQTLAEIAKSMKTVSPIVLEQRKQ
jgi:hypothetical protein